MISAKNFSLKQRIVFTGIVMAIAPLTVIGLVVNQHLNAMTGTAEEELAASDLSLAVDAVYQRLESSQADVEHSLLLAHEFLQTQGGVIQFPTRRVAWQTRRQAADPTARRRHRTPRRRNHQRIKSGIEQELPRIYVGTRALSPKTDRRHSIVDKLGAISGTNCTVFQRINVRGDMLSVSSNADSMSGPRLVGNNLAAYGADGKANPAIQAVLTKKRFVGDDGTLERNFIAAYEPVENHEGNVIGMLYVGLPREPEMDKIRRVLSRVKVGAGNAVFALHGNGAELGHLLFSSQAAGSSAGALPEGSAAEALVKAAEKNNQQTVEEQFETKRGIRMVAGLRYFAPMGWVVGIAVPLNEYGAAATKIRQTRDAIRSVLASGLVMSLIAAGAIWFCFGSSLIAPLRLVAKKLQDDAQHGVNWASYTATMPSGRNVTCASQTLDFERRVKDAQLSADQARNALTSLDTCDLHAAQATLDLDSMKQSMAELNSTSSKIGGIMKDIDQIALQSKILALNASIEAARAGGAGVSFAIVADEFGRLAERCKEAAQSTTGLVSDSIAATAAGSHALGKVTTAVSLMASNTQALKKAAGQAQAAGEQQKTLTGQLQSVLTKVQESAQVEAVRTREGSPARAQLEASVLAQHSVELSMLIEGKHARKSSNRQEARKGRKQRPQVSAAKAPAGTRSALREC